jgi:hypothetical protein
MFEESLIALLGEEADPVAAGWKLRELTDNAADHGAELAKETADQAALLSKSDPAIVGALLRAIHTVLLRSGQESIGQVHPAWLTTIASALPKQTPNRTLLLQMLAMIRTNESLGDLIRLLKEERPRDWTEGAQILSPLMQHNDWPVDALYPDALDLLQYATLASPLLDLCNYLLRTERIAQHPAADRLSMLNTLLGEVSGRLGKFEENPRAFGDDIDTVHKMLGEAVALAISLCDTVGLIGDESSIGKLNQTIDLKHRRVQCEAAGALARLGDDLGQKRLIEMTADPAARLRAIHYLDELDCGESVDDQYRSDTSTAEAELALWLTQPGQMGVPPTAIEVIDTKRMMWPSFDDPVDVFLVRFEYNFGENTYSNVGITGPVTFALSNDVANLPTDDIYAMYAGWHAEHQEIFAVAQDQFNDAQKRVMGTYQKHLDRLGYESIKPELLGFFLDEQSGVFTAIREGTQCVVVTDGLETIEQVTAGRLRPLTPGDVFNLFKGRKMLRTFNTG